MRNKIRNILKSSKFLYSIYFYIFSSLIKIMGLFIKVDNNQVLFVAYSGRKFDDSPKVLYEYMKKNNRYNNFKLTWAFENPQNYPLDSSEKVKIDSLKYYYIALKSKYWITNSSITRGLNFKNKKTKYIIFQHGTLGIKKLGADIANNNKSFKIKKEEEIDMFIIQGKKEAPILEKALNLKGKIYELGLPRNDELYDAGINEINVARKKLNIPKNKKVMLYAPTFREFYKDNKLESYVEMPFDIEEMRKNFEDEYVLLITAHYEVAKMLNIPENDPFVINAFKYPYINDLLLSADIIISDYSSVVFDYAILEKPILCYAYDYETYMKERGTYIDLNSFFYDGVIKTQKELIDIIKNMDYKKECEHSKKIKNEYLLNYVNTVKKAAEVIFNEV